MATVLAPQPLFIPAAHGSLEGLVQSHEAPRGVAVVCHPHPLYGGNMDNNVLFRVARALHRAGLETVRFNFRGVGGSSGVFAAGVGEQDDVRAALDFVAHRHPKLPIWVAGYSFGAFVGLKVGAADPRVTKLLGVGLAPALFDLGFLTATDKPKAFVQGELDEYGDGRAIAALVERMKPPRDLRVIGGARHVFAGKLVELERAVEDSIRSLDGR